MTDILNPEDLGLPSDFSLSKGSNGHRRNMTFLIIGGCGYLGWQLAQTLHKFGAFVKLLDLRLPEHFAKDTLEDERMQFLKGDICDYESVKKASKGVDCVYHVASFGLSGKDQLDKYRNEMVNVQGTKNIIRACKENGISRLIYTSSYNVVLEGRPIENATEDIPLARSEKMVDYYSKTKLQAEKLVTRANGSEVAGGATLLTCSLRPPGIFGPGEKRHLSRAASMIEMNIVVAAIGDATVDWVHVNNLVQAHLLALPALSPARNSIAAGKSYFISDNAPVKFFDFLRPLFDALGRKPPKFTCHYLIVYYVAFLMEMLYLFMKPWMTIEPLATRCEVIKMGVTHYQKMDKAIKELGYRPIKYDFNAVVEQFLRERPQSSGGFFGQLTKLVICGILLFCVVQLF